MYTGFVGQEKTLDALIERFLKKGGKIDKYYLRNINRSRRSLIYYNGWFSGDNIRSAIMKALGK